MLGEWEGVLWGEWGFCDEGCAGRNEGRCWCCQEEEGEELFHHDGYALGFWYDGCEMEVRVVRLKLCCWCWADCGI